MTEPRPQTRSPRAEHLEGLIYSALDELQRRGPEALESFLEQHPSDAPAVREQLAHLMRLGLAPQSSAPAALPARLGDFELAEPLGEGGMGVVHAARQVSLDRQVAVKLLHPGVLHDPGARQRFRREVAALARLQHPGIVPVLGAGEEQGVAYIAMERLDGCTLAAVLTELEGCEASALTGADLARAVAARSGATPAGALFEVGWSEACLRIARDVAEALEHAHARGIVHRDVKPANIALTLSGRALLFDFGLALDVDDERLTRTGGQAGSLAYMSPEQVDGRRDLDARTDLWSLGVVLYELLTLRAPFASASSELTRRRILAAEATRPRRLHRGLARDVETIVLCALERDRARRYAGAAELARDLGNALAGRPVEADRGGPWRALERWRRGHPRSSAAGATALVVGVLALGLFAWRESARRRLEGELRTAAELSAGLAETRADEAARSAREAERRTLEAVAAAELAEARRREAEAERRKVLRLSDARRLQRLRAELPGLYPAAPEQVDLVDAWLMRADELRGRVGEHRAALAELRAQARADDQELLWQVDTLAELVAGLEGFGDAQAQAEGLLDQALRIEEESVGCESARRAWELAVRSIRDDCPAYAGLEVAPQLGLLPLGRDPASGLWEFAELRSGAAPTRGPDGRLVPRPEDAVVLVLLPGGRFHMGSQSADRTAPGYSADSDSDEQPVTEIALEPFLIGKYELTQAQWQRATGTRPSQFRAGTTLQGSALGETNPVEMIDRRDAAEGLRRVGLELPSEAQWEYAARAGTDTPWSTGGDPHSLAGHVNLAGVEFHLESLAIGWRREEWLDDGFPLHAPVGSYLPNAFGLHDTMGNVSEWVRDAFGPYSAPARSGDGLRTGNSAWSVNRGGSFNDNAGLQRAAIRFQSTLDYRNGNLGVRAARALVR